MKPVVSAGRWTADSPVGLLPGVTPARSRALQEAGLVTVGDLLRHYPRRWEDRRRFDVLPSGIPEHPVCLRGTVTSTTLQRFGRRSRFRLTLAVPQVGGPPGAVECLWFNLPYIHRILREGQDLVVHGRLRPGTRLPGLDHPEFEILEATEAGEELLHLERIVPVHPSLGPWTPRMLRRLIHRALAGCEDPEAAVPGVPEGGAEVALAVREIHFPTSWAARDAARAVLARGELFIMQAVLALRRAGRARGTAVRVEVRSPLAVELEAGLPFALTAAQQRALAEIRGDLASGRPMDRLLQGDVGSGKTVVALLAMLEVVAAGKQAALMAPTQVLALQHHQTISRWLGPLGIRVDLLTGPRRETGSHAAQIVVGTHAVLYDRRHFTNPGLVVIDEQHKFGVRQRASLAGRSEAVHLLVMSATPIPRTLALTLYGDLEVSVLDERPPGRQPVQTVVRPVEKLPEAAAFLAAKVQAGRQAYIIYPLIEDDGTGASKAVGSEFARWEQLVAPVRCGLLHGRMKAADKEEVMRDFREGRVGVLVSTTVIEVGVDVPNATVMLVENAERFGLAQLHQLRGRIGRGSGRSHCILLGGAEAGDKLERLRILEQTSDGFAIAEADLALRGPGDLLGSEQTGLPPIRLARLPGDLPLLEEARARARALAEEDPALAQPRHQPLAPLLGPWLERGLAGTA